MVLLVILQEFAILLRYQRTAVREVVFKDFQQRTDLIQRKVYEQPFRNKDRLCFSARKPVFNLGTPRIFQRVSRDHRHPVLFWESLFPCRYRIRKVQVKPPDLSVIHAGKAVIETRADVHDDRIRGFF